MLKDLFIKEKYNSIIIIIIKLIKSFYIILFDKRYILELLEIIIFYKLI